LWARTPWAPVTGGSICVPGAPAPPDPRISSVTASCRVFWATPKNSSACPKDRQASSQDAGFSGETDAPLDACLENYGLDAGFGRSPSGFGLCPKPASEAQGFARSPCLVRSFEIDSPPVSRYFKKKSIFFNTRLPPPAVLALVRATSQARRRVSP
jgi:hypothetical protein